MFKFNINVVVGLTLVVALFAAIMATLAFFVHPTDSDDKRALISAGVHEDDALFISHGRDVAITSARTVEAQTGDEMHLLLTIPYDLKKEIDRFNMKLEFLAIVFKLPIVGDTLTTLFDEDGAPIKPETIGRHYNLKIVCTIELQLGTHSEFLSVQGYSMGSYIRVPLFPSLFVHDLLVNGTGFVPLSARIHSIQTTGNQSTLVKSGTYDIDVPNGKSIIAVGTRS